MKQGKISGSDVHRLQNIIFLLRFHLLDIIIRYYTTRKTKPHFHFSPHPHKLCPPSPHCPSLQNLCVSKGWLTINSSWWYCELFHRHNIFILPLPPPPNLHSLHHPHNIQTDMLKDKKPLKDSVDTNYFLLFNNWYAQRMVVWFW